MFSNLLGQVYLQAISSLIKPSNSGLDAYVVRNTTLAWIDAVDVMLFSWHATWYTWYIPESKCSK